MNRALTLRHAIIYILLEKTGVSLKNLLDILYIADLHHYILHGRTVVENVMTESYILRMNEVSQVFNSIDVSLEEKDLDRLSKSDKESIDFAILRQDTDHNKLYKSIIIVE